MENAKTGIYIDGLNFYYGALRDTNYKWLNLEAFARLLVPHDTISVIRYFTAPINARPGDPRITTRQSTYLRAVQTLPNVSVHQGRFTSRVYSRALADSKIDHTSLFTPHFRPRVLYSAMWKDKVRRRAGDATTAKVIIDEEKGTDVNIGVHLLNDAARQLINKAIVVSNDSDLCEAIQLSKEFGVKIGILNPRMRGTSKHLKAVASFEMPLRHDALAKCQFPPSIKDAKGKEISRPREWR
jgi:uncharacterized LabA/DUF88 family protein